MSKPPSIDELLNDFASVAPPSEPPIRSGNPVTIWLPTRYKAAFDRIQSTSGRRFSKKVREVIIAMIEHVEEREKAAS